MNDKLQGQLRHLLGVAAAYAAGKGWLNASDATEIINFLLIAAPFAWSWLAKKTAPTIGAPAPPAPDAGNPS